jgi:Holliday junction resolvase
VREKAIERKLVQAVKEAGGMAPKLVCPGMDGMPDRIVLMPQGIVAFVEVKSHGEKPRPLQVARMEALRRLGFTVYVLDDVEQIGGIVRDLRTA